MSRTSGAAPSAAAVERAERRASVAAFREPRDASCAAPFPVPGVGDEEGSVEHAPQVCDRRPGGGLPRAPIPIELGAAQRGERGGARIPSRSALDPLDPELHQRGPPGLGEDAGLWSPGELCRVRFRADDVPHDPAERGVERPAGPDRREGLLRHRPCGTGIAAGRRELGLRPEQRRQVRAGPAHAVHQRTGGRQVTRSVVRPTLIRVDPGTDDVQPRRRRAKRIEVQAFLGSSSPLRASGRGRTAPSRHARRGCRRRFGPRRAPAAVRSPPSRLRGTPPTARPGRAAPRGSSGPARSPRRRPAARQCPGPAGTGRDPRRPARPAAVTQPRIPSASAASPAPSSVAWATASAWRAGSTAPSASPVISRSPARCASARARGRDGGDSGIIATSGPPSSGLPTSAIDPGETCPTKSWSSQRGTARAASAAAASESSPGAIRIPRSDPVVRRWRASARVSTPAIAGMPLVRRSEASCRASSRTAAVALATTSPRSHGCTDWSSSIRRP